MNFTKKDQKNTWDNLSYQDKNKAMYLKQKQTLDLLV